MRVHVKQRRHEHPAAALDDRGGKGVSPPVERGDTAAVDVHVVCGKQRAFCESNTRTLRMTWDPPPVGEPHGQLVQPVVLGLRCSRSSSALWASQPAQ